MSKKILAIVLTLLVMLACVSACKPQPTSGTAYYGYAVGNKAIDFTLTDLNGNTVTLSSFLGRPVLLGFWDTA